MWLINDKNLKFVHIEIISLWIKTVANFTELVYPCLR